VASACVFPDLGTCVRGNLVGFLVDSGCFQMRENDVNPTDTDTSRIATAISRFRLCYPSAKSKRFVVIEQNGLSFSLDAAGNAKAELFQKTSRKKESYFPVIVTGDMNKNTVKVASIAKVPPK
jgi:hypothetical protein